MAGDWLQIDLDLPEKPEVQAISRASAICPQDGGARPQMSAECALEVTLGRLMLFWRWVERHASCELVRCADVHTLVSLCGGNETFWRAVESVGWVSFTDDGIVIPGWKKRFSKSAKRRIKDAKRKRETRSESSKRPQSVRSSSAERPQNVRRTRTECGPKEEKRRVEKSIDPNPLNPPFEPAQRAGIVRVRPAMIPIPDPLDTEEFRRQWAAWTAYFLELQPTTPQATFEGQLVTMARWGPVKAIRAMQTSITNGWKLLKDPDERKPSGKHASAGHSYDPNAEGDI